jgi:hypothetical protein
MVKLTPEFKRGDKIFVAYVAGGTYIRFVGPLEICEVQIDTKWVGPDFQIECTYKINALNERFFERQCYATKDEAWHMVNLQLEEMEEMAAAK